MRGLSARRLFAAAVIAYGLAVLASSLWPKPTFLGMLVGIPPFSIYVFEHFGVPWLTDRTHCDWMWCKPTIFGTLFTTAVWLGAAWLACLGIARLSRGIRGRGPGDAAAPRAPTS